MSQALFERAAQGKHSADSAGTQPADQIHPQVIDVMQELAIDLKGRKPKKLTTELAERADIVVTMGCGDECPFIPGKKYIDWDLQDPKGLPIDQVRKIRDDISSRVDALVTSLNG
jgi:arsenate reductase (thioredoxin)